MDSLGAHMHSACKFTIVVYSVYVDFFSQKLLRRSFKIMQTQTIYEENNVFYIAALISGIESVNVSFPLCMWLSACILCPVILSKYLQELH